MINNNNFGLILALAIAIFTIIMLLSLGVKKDPISEIKNGKMKIATQIFILICFIKGALNNYNLISKRVSNILFWTVLILYFISVLLVRFDLYDKFKRKLKKNWIDKNY